MLSNSAFLHEKLYRSETGLQKLRTFDLTICGAGALGANISENLIRTGFTRLRLIDRDRVEEQNISTQPYQRTDIGAFKAKLLANNSYRGLGVTIDARAEELTEKNVGKLLGGSSLVLDSFDNSGSRQLVKDYCAKNNLPCLHAGMAGDYAEVIWNEIYRVPSPAQDDICDYPLARNLIMLTVAVACESIINFAIEHKRESYTITLRDFSIKPFIGEAVATHV